MKTAEIRERSLEAAIEAALLAGGPDASAAPAVAATPPPFGEYVPGGYRKRSPEDYDRQHCLIPRDVLDFVYATQPKEWERLKQNHGAEVKGRFLARLGREVQARGTLDVLRREIKDSGCKFQLASFRPAKRVTDDREFARFFVDWLFERFPQGLAAD